MTPVDRRRCRHLAYGVVRHLGLLEVALARHVQRAPRPRLRAVLLMGAFELLENPGQAPAIVHHAVARARGSVSPPEVRLVNAVLRKVAETLAAEIASEPHDAAGLARRHSHPLWLVERWLAAWGEDATRRMLTWNQQPAPVHARTVDRGSEGGWPDFFRATTWPGFFLLEKPDWAEVERLLAAGRIYLQDPATALAPGLLDVRPGERVLDVCAAPGGKTLQLAEAAGERGRVVAVDLPGPRLERLHENLRRHHAANVAVVAADAAKLTGEALAAAGEPGDFDAVLVDVPCSNTGVLRHRVDVKWRLTPRDLETLPVLQQALLAQAAALVRPGGRLAYSTCSLEAEENAGVVQAFLASEAGVGWALADSRVSRPWEDGRDGAGAFLLRRG